MADRNRKEELERKKAKLQALREEKMRRQKEREQQEVISFGAWIHIANVQTIVFL